MQNLETLVEAVVGRIFIPLEASGRHVHVTKEQAMTLFGHGLTPKRDLSQPGQYLSHERLTVKGPKGEFQNVAVLGPERKEAQIEISLTDGRTLGVTPPIRPSGNVTGSPGCVLIGPKGTVTLSQGIIAAQRHIHMTPADAEKYGIKDNDLVDVEIQNQKPTRYYDVQVRVREDFNTEMHIDTDDANASAIKTGDRVEILTKD